MKNLLLGIIAINLTFISINLTLRSIEPVYAEFTWETYKGNDFNECMALANLETRLTSRVEARNICGEKFNYDVQTVPDNTKSCGTACISQGQTTKMKTYDGDDFTRRVKRIVETCEVVTSSGISNKIPGTNMSIGGRNKGKIDCN